MQKSVVFFITFLVLNACAGTPGGSMIGVNKPDKIGEYPKNYEATILADLNKKLKDPDSIKKLKISKPGKGRCEVGIYGHFHGWVSMVEFNAKNSFGAYTGLKTVYYWMSGPHILKTSLDPRFCHAQYEF